MLFNFSVSLLIGLEMGHLRSVREFFSRSTYFTVWFKIILYFVFMLFYQINLKTLTRFFEEIRNTLDLEHSPQDNIIDFAIAAINAVHTFEGTEMKGCFFHLWSNLWKQIQRSGLQQTYWEPTRNPEKHLGIIGETRGNHMGNWWKTTNLVTNTHNKPY